MPRIIFFSTSHLLNVYLTIHDATNTSKSYSTLDMAIYDFIPSSNTFDTFTSFLPFPYVFHSQNDTFFNKENGYENITIEGLSRILRYPFDNQILVPFIISYVKNGDKYWSIVVRSIVTSTWPIVEWQGGQSLITFRQFVSLLFPFLEWTVQLSTWPVDCKNIPCSVDCKKQKQKKNTEANVEIVKLKASINHQNGHILISAFYATSDPFYIEIFELDPSTVPSSQLNGAN